MRLLYITVYVRIAATGPSRLVPVNAVNAVLTFHQRLFCATYLILYIRICSSNLAR